MFKESVRITSKYGLHARPALKLVNIAMKYDGEVFISKHDFKANGKSILSLMALNAAFGDEIWIEADGINEEAVVKEMAEVVRRDMQ